MPNYKLTIQYEGTRYKGWQEQKHTEATIQGKLQRVLERMTEEEIDLQGSGRTDAGVHARGQVANFKAEDLYPVEEIQQYLNCYLPEDIAVTEVAEVNARFHSRYAAKAKTYRYRIHRGLVPDVFNRKYEYHYEKSLDVERMKQAAAYLTGTHDFTSFCGNKKMKKSAVRTVYAITFTEEGDDLFIDFRGNGFLQNMIRILTGTLIEVGDGRRKPEEIPDMLAQKNRECAGYTAPAQGLMLMNVEYE